VQKEESVEITSGFREGETTSTIQMEWPSSIPRSFNMFVDSMPECRFDDSRFHEPRGIAGHRELRAPAAAALVVDAPGAPVRRQTRLTTTTRIVTA